MGQVLLIIIYTFGAFIYFIPSFNAYKREQFWATFVVNLLFGWTVVGWIIALIMSWHKNDKQKPVIETVSEKLSVADELGKLAELLNKGNISQEEFNAQKKKLLG